MKEREEHYPSVIDMAYEIVDMQKEIQYLRSENKRLKGYEEKYTKLLDDSMKHGKEMAGNMLKCLLVPGVIEKVSKSKAFK